MTRAIREPARDVPIVAEPDVLVVGGGPAGFAAACAAARAGARTLLVESHGCLGGTLTIVTLGGFCGIHAVGGEDALVRVVGGLCVELEGRLAAVDAIPDVPHHELCRRNVTRFLGLVFDAFGHTNSVPYWQGWIGSDRTTRTQACQMWRA